MRNFRIILGNSKTLIYDGGMKHFTKILVLLLTVGFPAFSAGEGSSDSIARNDHPDSAFPVKAVTLYTAGLAQIVHEAKVEGDQTLLFPVEHSDLNDVLKSLIVEDLGGGTVESVNFSSSDSLADSLSSLRINPSGSPGILEFLKRTQGEEVAVETQEGQFSGRIFSVEESLNAQGDRRLILNLMSESGLHSVDILTLVNLRFLDKALQDELMKALSDIAQSRVKTSRLLKIVLKGEGKRTVRLSYIRAVPLWKTSYRIIIDEKGTPRLEGWALVQNTGDRDWDNVDLSFVAGRPNAFIMDMATPRYVYRDTVDTASAQPIGAVEFENGYTPSPAKKMESLRSSVPKASYEDYEAAADEYYGSGEAYTPAPAAAMAKGEGAGNFYKYKVNFPVTVEARSSAMIPILTSPDAGTPLAVYDPAQGGVVFKSLRLKNKTDAHWAAGPVSVIEGRTYGGDALLPDMNPGASRLISYAIHGSVEVSKTVESLPQRIISLKISGGVLQRQDKMERETQYRIEGKEKELILIHPKKAGWTLTEHPAIDEETPSETRFLLTGWDDQPVVVKEEYIISKEFSLNSLNRKDFVSYLEWGDLSGAMKSALQKMSSMKGDEDRIQNESSGLTSRISRLERDQSRVRDNMKVLETSSELYKKYSDQLSRQEEEIQSLNKQVDDKEKELRKSRQDLADYIRSLELD